MWLPGRHIDRQTDGQTDAGQSDPYVSLCFAGDTKIANFELCCHWGHSFSQTHLVSIGKWAWYPQHMTTLSDVTKYECANPDFKIIEWQGVISVCSFLPIRSLSLFSYAVTGAILVLLLWNKPKQGHMFHKYSLVFSVWAGCVWCMTKMCS